MRFLSRSIKKVEPAASPPTEEQLIACADRYIDFLGPHDRSGQEVREVGQRLETLMRKHGILQIGRRDCLIKYGYYGMMIEPLVRLKGGIIPDCPPRPNLIPLVDRYIEADGGYKRNKCFRDDMVKELATLMERFGYKFFVHRGWRLERIGKDYICGAEKVADYNG